QHHAPLALPFTHGSGAFDLQTNPGTSYGAAPDDLVGHSHCPLDRNGKSKPHRSTAAAEDGRVDADDLTQCVRERAAGVAGVDCGISLDHVQIEASLIATRENVAAGSAHHSHGDGRFRVAQ